jgi:hypothetical protein
MKAPPRADQVRHPTSARGTGRGVPAAKPPHTTCTKAASSAQHRGTRSLSGPANHESQNLPELQSRLQAVEAEAKRVERRGDARLVTLLKQLQLAEEDGSDGGGDEELEAWRSSMMAGT